MSIKVERCFDSGFEQAKIKINYRNKKIEKQDLDIANPKMDNVMSGERKPRMFAEVRSNKNKENQNSYIKIPKMKSTTSGERKPRMFAELKRNKYNEKQDLNSLTPKMDSTTSGERKTRMFSEVRRNKSKENRNLDSTKPNMNNTTSGERKPRMFAEARCNKNKENQNLASKIPKMKSTTSDERKARMFAEVKCNKNKHNQNLDSKIPKMKSTTSRERKTRMYTEVRRNRNKEKQDSESKTPQTDNTRSGERKPRIYRKTPRPWPSFVAEDSFSKRKKHEVKSEKRRNTEDFFSKPKKHEVKSEKRRNTEDFFSKLKKHEVKSEKKRNAADATSTPKHTQTELDLINQVLKCTNLYHILHVKRNDCESAIKKSYKKLALKLHPDKNNAPGAVDAFKKLNNAASILCDKHKREKYDHTGHSNMTSRTPFQQRSEPSSYKQERFKTTPMQQEQEDVSGRNGMNGNYYRDYERTYSRQTEDCDGEQFFQLFFNAFSFDSGEERRREERRLEQLRGNSPQREFKFWDFLCKYSILLALITGTILAFLVFTFIIAPSDYSFTSSKTYPLRRETKHLSIVYYVGESFPNDFKGNLNKFENVVENEFVHRLKQQCASEKQYRSHVTKMRKNYDSKKSYKPKLIRMKACEELSRLGIIRF